MRRVRLILVLILCVVGFSVISQEKKPKLFVGIVVDQMRTDYLYRFEKKYSDNGFRKLIREGFYGRNTHYNYSPTYTGPGHASIFTGTTPEIHGIIGNDWYVRALKSRTNCVDDSTVITVGLNDKSVEKSYSPVNLLSSNFADELKVGTENRSKVVGVSIKNRGAILPAGHFPDGAYWFDKETGNFVTSTYYTKELPEWVKAFNKRKLAEKYLTGKWEPLLDINTYLESGDDDSPYESIIGGNERPTFPYDLTKIRKNDKDYGFLPNTPFGNSIIKDMALAALDGEKLGKDTEPDLLTISFSSTDYVGHTFGPDAKEIEDTYLRLDRDIAEIISVLDQKVGKDEYVLFLTADHAVAQVPQFLMDKRIPAGYIKSRPIISMLSKKLNERFGEGNWIENVSNDQIFLDRSLIQEKKINRNELQEYAIDILLTFQGIKNVFTAQDMNSYEYTTGIKAKLQKGYNAKRSGDLLIVYEPGWFATSYGNTGTTHGSVYNYDSHVPLLMYGKGIPKGKSTSRLISITDIIPTLCIKYQINLPNGANGNPILEVTDL